MHPNPGTTVVAAALLMLMASGCDEDENQRLADYLEAQPQFLPLRNAQLLRSGRPPKEVNMSLGDVVLNQSAIQAVWETQAQRGADGETVREET